MKAWWLIVICISYIYTAQAADPLKILFVVDIFPKRTETFILNQIIELIDRGHDVRIHAYHRGKKNEIGALINNYNLLNKTSYGEWYPRSLDEFDILYCQFGTMGNKMLKQKQRTNSKTKLVTCFRGYDITCQLQKYPNTYASLLSKGDLFLPVCDFFAQKLITLGADPQKVIVHHSAIDCNMFSYTRSEYIPKNEITIVSVSRLIEKKGIEDVLRALALVVKKYPQVHYIIVGDGYLRSTLEAMVIALHLTHHVTFIGSVPHEKIASILKNADIAILPSVKAKNGNQEGIPNVLKEAMACGLPVISTYHAGIPELVEHGSSGLLAQESDYKSLASHILYLIKHPTERIHMGQLGRRKVEEEFDIEVLIPKLERHFYTLLDR